MRLSYPRGVITMWTRAVARAANWREDMDDAFREIARTTVPFVHVCRRANAESR